MGIVAGVIIKSFIFIAIAFVFISPVPAWAMMIGGTNRLIKKTGSAMNKKGYNTTGLNTNMNKVKNYFKNGGGQGIHDLPGYNYEDEPLFKHKKNKESSDQFKYNPVEVDTNIDKEVNQFRYNPIEANNSSDLTETNYSKNKPNATATIDRVDLKEKNKETIKVVNKETNKSYNDESITDEFFNDAVWDIDINDLKNKKKR